MCEIIQVDDRTEVVSQFELFRRGIVGREHDVMAGKTACIGHQKLCL